MKTKDCEDVTIKYKHMRQNYLGVDSTDHIAFFCKRCRKTMRVIEIVTRKAVYSSDFGKDNCTWIYLVCDKCEVLQQRKFYWKSEDGRFCLNITDKMPKTNKIHKGEKN